MLAEQGRIVGLAKAMLGDDTAAKLESLVKSGMTAEMALSAKTILESAAASTEKSGSSGDKTQAEMLEELKKANAQSVQTGAASGDLGFDALVSAAMKADPKLTKAGAIAFVARNHPEAHAAYVTAQQPKA